MTKPSRARSNGREAFAGSLSQWVFTALVAAKLPNATLSMGASLPPQSAMSASSFRIRRAASPMAWMLAAQAVTGAPNGPFSWCLIDTCPAARLARKAGTVKYPMIVKAWKDAWEQVIPFFVFPTAIRRVIYTTNAIESVNAQLRKIIKTRGHFLTDDAAIKLLWLALRNIAVKWGSVTHHWTEAMQQFAVLYEERFTRPVSTHSWLGS